MRPKRSDRLSLWIATIVIAASGCAQVNPRTDYDRTAQHITDATGYTDVCRPDDQPPPVDRVEALMKNGITADEAAQICLLNNPTLQAAFFRIGVARADLVQSGLLTNPSLAISLRFPDGGGLPDFEPSLAQNIADLWQIPARKRAADRSLDQAILEVAREASTLVAETKTAYYQARQADERRRISAENVLIAQQVLDLALSRQQAGAGGEVDVNLARSEVLEADLALRDATLGAFEARSSLATHLGLTDSPETLVFAGDLPDPAAWAPDDAALLALAGESRLDVRAARSATEAAQARVREAWLNVFKTFEVGFDLERNERRPGKGRNLLADSINASVEAGAPQLQINPVEKQRSDTILGPTFALELPIFDQNQAGIARAEYLYEQSLRLLDGLTRQLSQEVRLANTRGRTAWTNVRFYRDQMLPLRKASLDLSRTAYQAGRTPLLSVLEAERGLLAARAGYVESLKALAASLVELEKVTGRPIGTILGATSSRPAATQDSDRK